MLNHVPFAPWAMGPGNNLGDPEYDGFLKRVQYIFRNAEHGSDDILRHACAGAETLN